MSRLLRKPSDQKYDFEGKFQKFNLTENPFPSEPVVNKDSMDKRINGDIYEIEIRRKEYEQIVNYFLTQPQSDPNHLRLGYIIDTSYIGRGNGKSAFLVNLQQDINREYCLDISQNLNKCFAAYVTPEPGGRTKTFSSFVDFFFNAIVRTNVIDNCLATLKLEAINELYPEKHVPSEEVDEESLISNLNTREWFAQEGIDLRRISDQIFQNNYLQELPAEFPLFKGRHSLLKPTISQKDFEQYYVTGIKKNREKLDFIFSHLVRFFQAAGFNGAYILVDDFERIPDFQSARQKKDFALELRSCLFDGLYINARIGFYNFLLVLHAGVPRLISDAWAESGMENRAPISPITVSKHVIPFEKLSKDHASLLLQKYLAEYRIDERRPDKLFPFTKGAVSKIGELSEYNAAKILKMAYGLLDKASTVAEQTIIDEKFVTDSKGVHDDSSDEGLPKIEDAESVDLLQKARNEE
jgi:hypothetical protein